MKVTMFTINLGGRKLKWATVSIVLLKIKIQICTVMATLIRSFRPTDSSLTKVSKELTAPEASEMDLFSLKRTDLKMCLVSIVSWNRLNRLANDLMNQVVEVAIEIKVNEAESNKWIQCCNTAIVILCFHVCL